MHMSRNQKSNSKADPQAQFFCLFCGAVFHRGQKSANETGLPKSTRIHLCPRPQWWNHNYIPPCPASMWVQEIQRRSSYSYEQCLPNWSLSTALMTVSHRTHPGGKSSTFDLLCLDFSLNIMSSVFIHIVTNGILFYEEIRFCCSPCDESHHVHDPSSWNICT